MPNSTFGLQTEFVYMLKRKYWIIHVLCQLACFMASLVMVLRLLIMIQNKFVLYTIKNKSSLNLYSVSTIYDTQEI